MFGGEKINTTEGRRSCTSRCAPADASIVVDGDNVVPAVHAVLDQMASFAERRAQRRVEGYTGQRFATSSTSALVARTSAR